MKYILLLFVWIVLMVFTLVGLCLSLTARAIFKFAIAIQWCGDKCLNGVHNIITWGDDLFGREI